MKRFLSIVLTFCLVLGAFASPIFAESSSQEVKKAKWNIWDTIADETKNTISAPDTVQANQAFTITLIGDRQDVRPQGELVETRFQPKRISITTSNEVLTHSFSNAPYSGTFKIKTPGVWTITGTFLEEYYMENYNMWYGDEYFNKSKPINVQGVNAQVVNVQGKVKFNANKRGKIKGKKTKYINQNSKIGKLPKVKAKKGYKFKGWYTKKKGGKRIKKNSIIKFKKPSITLYAQYKKKKK